MENKITFQQALESFITKVQEMIDKDRKSSGYPFETVIAAVPGRKYIKVTKKDTQTSVWCFIDVATGDILKPATWSAPAKHARGNIYNENPLDGCNVYGPNYR